MNAFNTPILFLVFNRPETTAIVFEAIRQQRPSQLFISADGAREGNDEDVENCRKVKDIVQEIDWDCKIHTLYREENLGCKKAVSTAISWFFEHVEEGIILEDDILPQPYFFTFCSEMLNHYRYDERVMHITGFNVCGKWKSKQQDYHTSYFGSIWGWASWKRAWANYDVTIQKWADPEVQQHILTTYFPEEFRGLRKQMYDDLYDGKINTWDYQWTFARLLHNGLSVIPSVNLIENIGFNVQATNTTGVPLWVPLESYSLTQMRKRNDLNIDATYDFLHLKASSTNRPYSDFYPEKLWPLIKRHIKRYLLK